MENTPFHTLTETEQNEDLESFFQVSFADIEKQEQLIAKITTDSELPRTRREVADLLGANSLSAASKFTLLVQYLLKTYPSAEFSPKALSHTCYVVLSYADIWFIEVLGGVEEYWRLLLSAAKEWFPEKNKSEPGGYFCTRFECEALAMWNGREEFRELEGEYAGWRNST